MLTTFLHLIRPKIKVKNSLICLSHPLIFKRRINSVAEEPIDEEEEIKDFEEDPGSFDFGSERDPEIQKFNTSEVEKYRKKAGNIDDKLYHSDVYAKMAEMEMANVIQPTAKATPQVKKSCQLCKLIGKKAQIDAMVNISKN